MAVWRVSTDLDDGTSYETVVLASTGVDAGVLVGQMIRAARDVDVLSGQAGIHQQSAHRLPEDYTGVAVNQAFQHLAS